MPLRLALALILTATAASAQVHPCEADARSRAGALLALHWNFDGAMLADQPGEPDGSDRQAWSLDDTATLLDPVPTPSGGDLLEGVELRAYVYRASYLLRFHYAQLPDACVLIGQSIVEDVQL